MFARFSLFSGFYCIFLGLDFTVRFLGLLTFIGWTFLRCILPWVFDFCVILIDWWFLHMHACLVVINLRSSWFKNTDLMLFFSFYLQLFHFIFCIKSISYDWLGVCCYDPASKFWLNNDFYMFLCFFLM